MQLERWINRLASTSYRSYIISFACSFAQFIHFRRSLARFHVNGWSYFVVSSTTTKPQYTAIGRHYGLFLSQTISLSLRLCLYLPLTVLLAQYFFPHGYKATSILYGDDDLCYIHEGNPPCHRFCYSFGVFGSYVRARTRTLATSAPLSCLSAWETGTRRKVHMCAVNPSMCGERACI